MSNRFLLSQAAPMRRVYVKGNLKLWQGASIGGFMADCKIDGTVFSGSRQQWVARNSVFKKWDSGVLNMRYVGVIGIIQTITKRQFRLIIFMSPNLMWTMLHQLIRRLKNGNTSFLFRGFIH